jgi:hypothetical protein
MIRSSMLALALASVALAPVAVAQTVIGTVTSVTGPAGSVVVVRGSQTYTLAAGDQLLSGDQVVTRTTGSAVINASGCSKNIASAASIVVNTAFCNASPVTLAGSDVVGGVPVGAGAGGAIGGTQVLLALAGGIAVATALDNSSSP